MHPSDVPDIRARELLTVMALAEYGSFVAAAAYLKTSQPALTRTIKRVERVLGVTLFARNTRRVEITAAGREFVAVAERMLNELHLTVRNLSEVTNEQRGRITLTTYSAFAVNPLPKLVRRYRETRPLIEVRIREGRQSEIVEDVRNGAADFGIGYVNALPDLLEATVLKKEQLYVLIPSSHPLALKKTPARPPGGVEGRAARLGAQRHLPASAVDAAAMSAGFTLHYSVTVDRLLSILHHVFAGVGIGILPSGCIPDIQWGEGCHSALLVEPSLSVTVGLISSRSRYMTPAAAGMAALIREQMAVKKQ